MTDGRMKDPYSGRPRRFPEDYSIAEVHAIATEAWLRALTTAAAFSVSSSPRGVDNLVTVHA